MNLEHYVNEWCDEIEACGFRCQSAARVSADEWSLTANSADLPHLFLRVESFDLGDGMLKLLHACQTERSRREKEASRGR